jgi:hypothetical protein
MNMSVVYWDGEGVSVQALKAEIIKLGTEFPDKWATCVYSLYGTPVCIVGRAVFNITGKVVENNDWFGQIDSSHRWIKALGGEPIVARNGFNTEDYDAYRFAADAQNYQDAGHTWSEAVAYAERRNS